jgi:hypothetical protein
MAVALGTGDTHSGGPTNRDAGDEALLDPSASVALAAGGVAATVAVAARSLAAPCST